MSNNTTSTREFDPCRNCTRIIRECGEVLGCACDLGLVCGYASCEE